MRSRTLLRSIVICLTASILLTETQDGISKTLTVGLSGGYDYSNIQGAINAAVNGDIVLVYPGTYTGSSNINIDFTGKAITLQSVSGPKSTVLDCQHSGRGFFFHTNEGRSSVVDGFTVKNGVTDSMRYGGGIGSRGVASPTIRDCIITGCTAQNGGGGIALSGARIENSIVFGNTAGWAGGGIWTDHSSLEIVNCTIANNSAVDYANGLCHWQNGQTSIINSIFWNYGSSEIYVGTLSTVSVTYSDIKDGFSGNGNISFNPLFGLDYSLLPESPCIDAGCDAGLYTDILGKPRPYDFPGVDNNGSLADFDIGAYEAIPEPATLLLLGLGAAMVRLRSPQVVRKRKI